MLATTILAENHKLLLKLAYRRTSNYQSAEDVLQDAFIRLANVTEDVGIGYVINLVKWIALNYHRSYVKYVPLDMKLHGKVAAPEPEVEPVPNLSVLTTGQRSVIEAVLAGVSQNDYARSHGLDQNTVRAQYRLGLLRLQKEHRVSSN